MPGRVAATAIHYGVDGGPDSAILYALMTLRQADYEWIILIENDVLVDDGWLEALVSAAEAAGRDGFRVGGASCRVIADRVLSFNTAYSLLFNAGAGFVALTREGVDLVIGNYRTIDTREVVGRFTDLTGVDISGWWPACRDPSVNLLLSADWMFDVALATHGLVVAAPPVTFARNIDPGHGIGFVETTSDIHDASRGVVPRGSCLRPMTRSDIRFPSSLISERVVVGCQHWRVSPSGGDRSGPVTLSGPWKRRWVQFYGPFELFGTGSLAVELFDAPLMLLVHAREGRAMLELRAASGATQTVEVDPSPHPLPLVEVALNIFGQRRGIVTMTVVAGAVGIIGLCMARELTPHFANEAPDFGFLAL